MQSRRNFLKTSLLGGSAFGLGLAAGILPFGANRSSRNIHNVVLQAYLPADAELVQQAVEAFAAGLPVAGNLPRPSLQADSRWHQSLLGGIESSGRELSGLTSNRLEMRIEKIDFVTNSDLLLQSQGHILDPTSDFGSRLLTLRQRLQGRPAEIVLSAVYTRTGLSDLFRSGERELIVDRQGSIERIALNGRERSLTLDGPAGRTRVLLDKNGVRVVEAGCRHHLCQKQGYISRPGERIACAPNRLLLTIS